MIYFTFFILFLIFGVLAIILAVLVDIVFIGHDFTTTKKAAIQVSDILLKRNKQKSVIYDLGSCRGDFLLRLTKHCPQLHAFGIDKSHFRVWLCRMKAFLLRRPATFLQGDLLTADVSNADVVYLYLDQSTMLALEAKLRKELKPGTLVITNTLCLPSWSVSRTVVVHLNKPAFEKLFVYEKI